MRRTHFLLIGFGFDGDILPLLTLAILLKERGCRVTLVAPIAYEEASAARGVQFVALSDNETYDRSIRDTYLLYGRYSSLFALRYGLNWNRVVYNTIVQFATGDTMMLAVHHGMLWADLVGHRHLHLPLIRIAIDPPPCQGITTVPRFTPSRTLFGLTAKLEARWGQLLREFDILVGPYHQQRLIHSILPKVPLIGLWPEWVGILGGGNFGGTFGSLRPARRSPFSPSTPVSSTRKLIIIVAGTAGTYRNWAEGFFSTSIQVCRELCCDALLLGGFPPKITPSEVSIEWREFVDLEVVLPQASAIIHHGGIGTAAAAVRHCIPQLVVPRVFAQSSNAAWLTKAGVAEVIKPQDYYVSSAADALRQLLAKRRYVDAAKKLSVMVSPSRTEKQVCRFLLSQGAIATKPVRGNITPWGRIKQSLVRLRHLKFGG